ncbi:MAG: hypothetical protein R3195_00525 [Gemmatimonadota bacterium]|nr:hypothetical protein [Gemmatimonadota bacterium]
MRVLAALLAGMLAAPAAGRCQESTGEHLTIGLFIASIEEGARVFTPVRLLPFEHPEAEGHEFPNALALHRSEYELLVALGRHSGLGLAATLQRYPGPPTEDWPYDDFIPPVPPEEDETVVRLNDPPLPGLRAALLVDGDPRAFIVDTRGLTLDERDMARPTTMGLDITRAELLAALAEVATRLSQPGRVIVTFP